MQKKLRDFMVGRFASEHSMHRSDLHAVFRSVRP